MARRYSQMEPPPSPNVHERTISSPHAVLTHMCQTYNKSVWTCCSQICRKKHFSVFIQYKLVGPITCKPKHQDSSCFPLFILCTRIMKIFVFCWCVHIAYVSIWCPVDIVWIWISLISVGFILHVGWERRERGQGVFVFYSGCSLGDLFIHFLALKVHKCRCIA